MLRHASYPEKFAQALATFVYEYSQENSRVNERPQEDKPVRRPNIRIQDVEEVLTLISKYKDSETVANLLVAFGYASDSRQNDDEDQVTSPGRF